MKSMLALMAGTMMFAACSNDDITENVNEQKTSELKPMTFTASMEGEAGATRAAIDGLDINWEETDKISIFDGNADANGILAREFTLDGDGGSTSGTFTGKAAKADTYYALYPYTESKFKSEEVTQEEAEAILEAEFVPVSYLGDWKMSYEDYPDFVERDMSEYIRSEEAKAIILTYLKGEKVVTKSGPQRNDSDPDQFEEVVLPAVQTATAGSADPKAMLMIGTSTDASTLQFKNVCAYVKVTPQFDCTRIVLKSNGTESLAGTMTVDYNGGAPTTTVTKGAKTVKLTGDIKANNTYYIAVRPGTLASGFTITFVAADYEYKKSTSNEVSFTRSHVTNLGSFATSNLTIAEMTGTATAIIDGDETNVKWSQLWAGGPKFAEYNVGASSATETGNTMLFAEATKTGADYVWGANWRTPSKDEMDELVKASSSSGSDKVTCEYTQVNDVWGFKFTGKGGYSESSVFLPSGGDGSWADAHYWSSTNENGIKRNADLFWNGSKIIFEWYGGDGDYNVRPVLVE